MLYYLTQLASIPISNLMLCCPSQLVPTPVSNLMLYRFNYKIQDDYKYIFKPLMVLALLTPILLIQATPIQIPLMQAKQALYVQAFLIQTFMVQISLA